MLAQAGVVDAGGAGYLLFLDAVLSVVDGRPLPGGSCGDPRRRPVAARRPSPEMAPRTMAETGSDLRYEVMYLLDAPDDTMSAFKEVWAGLGDSIVVVGGDGLWNCHIHTNDVGAAIEAALDAGRPRNIRVTDSSSRSKRSGGYAKEPEPARKAAMPTGPYPAPPWWRWPTARASAGSSAPSASTTSWPGASR